MSIAKRRVTWAHVEGAAGVVERPEQDQFLMKQVE